MKWDALLSYITILCPLDPPPGPTVQCIDKVIQPYQKLTPMGREQARGYRAAGLPKTVAISIIRKMIQTKTQQTLQPDSD